MNRKTKVQVEKILAIHEKFLHIITQKKTQ